MKIADRFMLTVATENQPAGAGKQWASLLDVNKFLDIARASKPVAALPTEVQIELVDELNPKNNRHTVQPIRIGPK